MGEAHPLDGSGGITPNAQPNQAQMYATAGQPAYVNPAGLQMGLVGAQTAFFPNLTNPAAGTTLVSLGAWTIPANDAAIGAVYEIEIWGNGQWGSTQESLGLQVVFGGNNMATCTLGASWYAINTQFRFRLAGRAICHTTGAGGTWTTLLYGDCSVFGANALPATGANGSGSFVGCESTGTTTVDTTSAQSLGVSCAWQATTGASTITSRVAIAKRIC